MPALKRKPGKQMSRWVQRDNGLLSVDSAHEHLAVHYGNLAFETG
jgi:hypothetical protein